jgi:transposase
LSDDAENMIIKLYSEGKNYREINKELGVSYREIARVLREYEKKKLAKDPVSALEEQANLEERRARALKKIEKARELIAEPGLLQRLIEFEVSVIQKLQELERRIAKVEGNNITPTRTFKDEIGDLVKLQRLSLMELEARKRLWGF